MQSVVTSLVLWTQPEGAGGRKTRRSRVELEILKAWEKSLPIDVSPLDVGPLGCWHVSLGGSRITVSWKKSMSNSDWADILRSSSSPPSLVSYFGFLGFVFVSMMPSCFFSLLSLLVLRQFGLESPSPCGRRGGEGLSPGMHVLRADHGGAGGPGGGLWGDGGEQRAGSA